uniref:Signal peptidase complex subunit 2 n=1 Tax=Oryza punctata TaxID=4537 RepID=A0A0E0KR52_ORYPU
MASDGASATPAKASPKKANLLDPHSIKHLLDETISDVVKSKGYAEDTRLGNWKLAIGAAVIAIALLAQFYPKKFPQNREFLLGCIALYPFDSVIPLCSDETGFGSAFGCCQLAGIWFFGCYTKEKDAIMFTHPPAGSFNSTGLVISSKLPRFSDMYTLTIASADPQSISANKPVHFTKSVTKWFTKEGVLVEGLFWKDVERLIDDYNTERKGK